MSLLFGWAGRIQDDMLVPKKAQLANYLKEANNFKPLPLGGANRSPMNNDIFTENKLPSFASFAILGSHI